MFDHQTHKYLKFVLVVIMAGLISSCSHLPNPLKGRPKPIKPGPLPELSQPLGISPVWLWQYKLDRASDLAIPPAIGAKQLYIAQAKGIVTALDKLSGQCQWQVTLNAPIATGPTLIGDRLYVATKDAQLFALSTDGKIHWQVPLSTEVLAPPQGNQQIVLVNATDGQLSALDAQNGQLMWNYSRILPDLTLRGGSAPILAQGFVYAGFANGKLVKLQARSGLLEWEETITFPRGRSEIHRMVDIIAAPVVAQDRVYIATYQGQVSAHDTLTGKEIWHRDISSYFNIASDAKHLYVTDAQSQLYALDKQSGATLWKQPRLANRYITAPQVLADYILVGDIGGYIHCIDKNNGQLLSYLALGKKISTPPVVEHNIVYVTTDEGSLSAFKLVK